MHFTYHQPVHVHRAPVMVRQLWMLLFVLGSVFVRGERGTGAQLWAGAFGVCSGLWSAAVIRLQSAGTSAEDDTQLVQAAFAVVGAVAGALFGGGGGLWDGVQTAFIFGAAAGFTARFPTLCSVGAASLEGLLHALVQVQRGLCVGLFCAAPSAAQVLSAFLAWTFAHYTLQ